MTPNVTIHRTSGKLRLPPSGYFQRWAYSQKDASVLPGYQWSWCSRSISAIRVASRCRCRCVESYRNVGTTPDRVPVAVSALLSCRVASFSPRALTPNNPVNATVKPPRNCLRDHAACYLHR